MTTPYKMRTPCKSCGGTDGFIKTNGGQDCVFCAKPSCGKHNYNAPKTETGRAVRTIETVHAGIDSGLRMKILLRDGGRCRLCGKEATPEHPLHVGHCLSVKDGMEQGLSDSEINHPCNLCALCDGCNLWLKTTPFPVWLAVALVMARLKNEHAEGKSMNLFEDAI